YEHEVETLGSPLDSGKKTTEKWLKLVRHTSEGTTTLYLRKTADTFKAVIPNNDIDVDIRWAALREIRHVELSDDDRLALIVSAATDPNVRIRYMAMLKAREFD